MGRLVGCMVLPDRWVRVGGRSMRPAKKNLRTMYYALYSDKIPVMDDNGNPTFESEVGYLEPVQFQASLSAGASTFEEQPFGADVQYDRIILTYDMECPIDEHSRIWVKNNPFPEGDFEPDTADYEVSCSPLDSLNVIRIPIKRR